MARLFALISVAGALLACSGAATPEPAETPVPFVEPAPSRSRAPQGGSDPFDGLLSDLMGSLRCPKGNRLCDTLRSVEPARGQPPEGVFVGLALPCYSSGRIPPSDAVLAARGGDWSKAEIAGMNNTSGSWNVFALRPESDAEALETARARESLTHCMDGACAPDVAPALRAAIDNPRGKARKPSHDDRGHITASSSGELLWEMGQTEIGGETWWIVVEHERGSHSCEWIDLFPSISLDRRIAPR